MESDMKRSDELLNDYKAELEKEIRELMKAEYEEKIRKLNESLEKSNKEIENYKEEVKKINTDLDTKEKSIEKMRKFCEQLGYEYTKAEDDIDRYDLPAILLPENQYAVEMSAKFLDPRSFTRFILCNRRLYSLAQSGRLTAPMKLSIWAENPETPFFQTPFGDDALAMMYLAKVNWFRYELKHIFVGFCDDRSILRGYEAKLDKLLKWANITYIDSVTMDYDRLKCRFLQYCKVRRFKADPIDCLQFLDYPNVLKIEDISLRLTEDRSVEEEKRSGVKLMRFLERSSAKIVYIKDIGCPIDFLPNIIGLWQSGQRNFETMELIGVRVDENKYVIQEFMAKNSLVRSKMQLENMSRAKVLEMLKNPEPCVIVGSDENFIVGSDEKFIAVKEDLQMLQIGINYIRYTCNAYMAILV